MISFALLLICATAHAKNVLIASSVPSPSHNFFDYALAEGLMAKGYNVTMFDPDASRHQPTSLFHPIQINGIYEYISKEIPMVDTSDWGMLGLIQFLSEIENVPCNYIYNNSEALKRLFDYPKDFKFDLIVLDVSLGYCLYPLIQRFNFPPTIGITAFLLPQNVAINFGGSPNTAYIPSLLLRSMNDLNYIQRFKNFFLTHIDYLYYELIVKPKVQALHWEKLGSSYLPNEILDRHVSLVLANFDPIVSYPQSVPPNIIPVGGLHVRPAKPLPNDLEQIVQQSKNGIIIFSLGSNVRSDNLSNATKQAFLEVFRTLPYTILWKYESELSNLPLNVVIRKWLPVNDLLGHKKTKLFLSHGGALSTQEAIFHGVPVLGLPFFTDQFINIAMMLKMGVAESLAISKTTSEEIREKINLLLSPKYKKKMEDVSNRYRDQPQTPLERAVFWAEYAIRHNGTQFLNPQSRSMTLIEAANYDIVAVSVLIVIVSVFAFIYALKLACKLFRRKKTKTE